MYVKTCLTAFSALNIVVATASAQSILDAPQPTKSPAAAALAAVANRAAQPAAAPAQTSTAAKPAASLQPVAQAAAQAAPKQPVAVAQAPASQASSPATLAPVVAVASGSNVTIRDLAARQANALAADATKSLSAPPPGQPRPQAYIGELAPASPIPVVMNAGAEVKPIKPAKPAPPPPPPPPPKPYFAALVGLKGQEVAEIHLGERVSFPLKVGGSVENWTLKQILDGRLILTSTEPPKTKTEVKQNRRRKESKKKTIVDEKNNAPVVKEKVVSVGEFI